MGLWPAPRALKGGHGERLRRREQPQQAPSGQGEASDEITRRSPHTGANLLHSLARRALPPRRLQRLAQLHSITPPRRQRRGTRPCEAGGGGGAPTWLGEA